MSTPQQPRDLGQLVTKERFKQALIEFKDDTVENIMQLNNFSFRELSSMAQISMQRLITIFGQLNAPSPDPREQRPNLMTIVEIATKYPGFGGSDYENKKRELITIIKTYAEVIERKKTYLEALDPDLRQMLINIGLQKYADLLEYEEYDFELIKPAKKADLVEIGIPESDAENIINYLSDGRVESLHPVSRPMRDWADYILANLRPPEAIGGSKQKRRKSKKKSKKKSRKSKKIKIKRSKGYNKK